MIKTLAAEGAYHKYIIKQNVEGFLFKPTQEAFDKELKQIAVTNALINKAPHIAFTYKNGLYCGGHLPVPKPYFRLSSELRPRMDALLNEIMAIDSFEKPIVTGFVTACLNHSENYFDCFKLLPECVHDPIRSALRNLSGEPTISDQAIKEIMSKHPTAVALIKKRVLLNLVT